MPSSPVLAPIIGASAKSVAERIPPWIWLAVGALATIATGPRYGNAAIAWLAPLPYLLYVRRVRTWRGWLALAGALLVAYPLQLLQIATPPVPMIAVVGFGAPMGLGMFVAYGAAEAIRRRAGEGIAIYALAALAVVMGWLVATSAQLGAWAQLGNSQVGELALIQLTSLFGLAGITFLMAWFAAAVANVLGAPAAQRRWRHAAGVAMALGAALTYGSCRLDATHERTVVVAAVVTDLGLDEKGLPDAATLAANEETLFARTELAASRGARLVVWNEVATMIEPAHEAVLVERGRREAQRLGVDLVLGYGVLVSREPLLFENTYAFIASDGAVLETYRKHHPVPGEPSVAGTEPIRALDRPYGRVAGAICYDYDFAELARQHGRLGVDLVFIPSSDWRGIDPVHTAMARTRGVEGGYSIVRSTRWGASGAYDAYGRTRATMATTEANDRVMIATVPVEHVPTLAAAIGETPVAIAGAYLVLAFAVALRRSGGTARRRRAAPQP